MTTSTTTIMYSGESVDLLSPNPDSIKIQDIARGLANESRFNGQTNQYYSVAQHSLLVESLINSLYPNPSKLLQLEALLHDAQEAYTKDIPVPLKNAMDAVTKPTEEFPGYRAIEQAFEITIRRKYHLPSSMSEKVNNADKIALEIEDLNLKPHSIFIPETVATAYPMKIERILSPNLAEILFLKRYYELNNYWRSHEPLSSP